MNALGLIGQKLSQRKWALITATALALAGPAWTFFWPATYRHFGQCWSPGDIWGTYNNAQGILAGQ